jgi:hypothetical protein
MSILAHSSGRTRENTNKSLQGMKQNEHENTQGNHNGCPEQQQSEKRQENKAAPFLQHVFHSVMSYYMCLLALQMHVTHICTSHKYP